MDGIRALCTTLFIASENSYSGFWMRGICVCALKLDLSISILGSLLSDSTETYSEARKPENRLQLAVDGPIEALLAALDIQVDRSARADILRTSFSSLTALFSYETLPTLYNKFLHEIMDLAS